MLPVQDVRLHDGGGAHFNYAASQVPSKPSRTIFESLFAKPASRPLLPACTQDGHPDAQPQLFKVSSARRHNSSQFSNTFSAMPMPPGVVSYKKIRAAAGPVSFGFGSCVAPATSLVSHIAILATSPPHTFATPFVASRSASAATRRLTTSSGRLKNTARVRYCAAITGVFQISSWSNFPVL